MMPLLPASLVSFLKGENGSTSVEYAVMLALIVVVCMSAISHLGSAVSNTFQNVGNVVGTSGS
jgi:pilus assembly protein Flp/PilA